MFARFLKHSRYLCVSQNKLVSLPSRRNNFSYVCKDKLPGQQNIPESENVTLNVTSGDKGQGLTLELSEDDIQRRNLQTKALSFLVMVNETALNSKQQGIHRAHVGALKAGDMTYLDPMTGYEVMTRLAHLQRGDCCGNACRHCPFGQKSAPEELRRIYNSAFYE